MLQLRIGSGLQTSRCRFSIPPRKTLPQWLPALALTVLGGSGAAMTVSAQAASGPTPATRRAATSVTPLPRFVPHDRLSFYVDFDGLEDHTEAWQKTALASLQGALPELTLVAELHEPVAFGKALDAIMLAMNKELKAQTMEKAAEGNAADEAGKAAGQGHAQARGFGRRPGGGAGTGSRPARRRSLKDTPAPEFRLMPGNVKTYMLHVPPDSPLKIVPPGVRPTIRMEENHIAVSSTSEAARAALETVKRGWKPGPDVEQVLSHLPPGPIFLAVGDPRVTMPSLLASLSGTHQAQINSVIAGSAGGSPASGPNVTRSGRPAAGPGFSPRAAGPGPGGFRSTRSGMSGYPNPAGAAIAPGPDPAATPSRSQDAMIQLQVDAAKLPKAEELKALMFPGTLAVVVDQTSIRLASRESFPSVVGGLGMGMAFASGFVPAFDAARARALAAAGVPPGQAAPTPAAGNVPAPAQPPAASGGPGQPGAPRGSRRGGRPGGGRPPG